MNKKIEEIQKEYLTINEAASYLGKTKGRIWQLIHKGNRFNKLPTETVFGKIVIKKTDLDNAII